MTKIVKPMRGRRPGKRLDLTEVREALRDRRSWTGLGVVAAPADGGEHYEIVMEGGEAVDIMIEVDVMPDNVPVSARLSGFAGGAGAGIWTIPAIGDEVALLFPSGSYDWMPMIVGVLASRAIPNGGGQGPAPARTIIVNSEVLVHDGSGGAVPLALKSDVEAVDNKYANHLHQDSTSAPTSAPLATVIPNPGGPTPPFVPGAPLTAANIVGTEVLKAK